MLWDESSVGFLGRIRAVLNLEDFAEQKNREIVESWFLDPVVPLCNE